MLLQKWPRKESKNDRDWKSWQRQVDWADIDVEAEAGATAGLRREDAGIAEAQVGEEVQRETIPIPIHALVLDLIPTPVLDHPPAHPGEEAAPGTNGDVTKAHCVGSPCDYRAREGANLVTKWMFVCDPRFSVLVC